jgi:hypothetical protein
MNFFDQVWVFYEILAKLLKLMDSLSCPLCPAPSASLYMFWQLSLPREIVAKARYGAKFFGFC